MPTTPTDYQFPAWFWDNDTSDQQRAIWMTQERCRRQAQRQSTPHLDATERDAERAERRLDAHPDTVDLSEHR